VCFVWHGSPVIILSGAIFLQGGWVRIPAACRVRDPHCCSRSGLKYTTVWENKGRMLWVLVSTALLAIVLTLGLLWILVSLKKKAGASAPQPNHRAFFFMGVVMLIAGTAELLIFLRSDVSYVVALPLLVIGLVFVVIGLVNRDKWRRM